MPINPAFATAVFAGKPLYRITASTFRTSSSKLHTNVVNGAGAVKSRHGARYNHPGALTVYLAEDLETALAERMFYFHREVIQSIDALHLPGGGIAPFSQTYVLWEIELKRQVLNVLDLTLAGAAVSHGVFPSLMFNPSQDYWHLKDRRASIQSSSYEGLIAPSSRSTAGGRMIVLFRDQSTNVARITPFDVTFGLLQPTPPGTAFVAHVSDKLDFLTGSVDIPAASAHSPMTPYRHGARVKFNH